MSMFVSFGARASLWDQRDSGSSSIGQRTRRLTVMSRELLGRGLDAKLLDHTESQGRDRDRQVLAQAFRGYQIRCSDAVAESTEPLLWFPDGIAWAAGRGGPWRRKLDGWVAFRSVEKCERPAAKPSGEACRATTSETQSLYPVRYRPIGRKSQAIFAGKAMSLALRQRDRRRWLRLRRRLSGVFLSSASWRSRSRWVRTSVDRWKMGV